MPDLNCPMAKNHCPYGPVLHMHSIVGEGIVSIHFWKQHSFVQNPAGQYLSTACSNVQQQCLKMCMHAVFMYVTWCAAVRLSNKFH